MEQGEGGSLVLVSSLAGIEAPTRNTLYGATKAAVLSVMRGLATEYAREGIRTNAILPGWIETEMTQRSVENQKFTDKVISRVPFRTWGTRTSRRRVPHRDAFVNGSSWLTEDTQYSDHAGRETCITAGLTRACCSPRPRMEVPMLEELVDDGRRLQLNVLPASRRSELPRTESPLHLGGSGRRRMGGVDCVSRMAHAPSLGDCGKTVGGLELRH